MSGLARRLGQVADLSVEERRGLELACRDRRIVKKGQVIAHAGTAERSLWVLNSGLAHSAMVSGDGERQILLVHVPGDLMGASNLMGIANHEQLTAIEDGQVTRIGHDDLWKLLSEQPRVGALLFVAAQTERLDLLDRLQTLGRASSVVRVARLLLHILERMARETSPPQSLRLPLSQVELGQLAGLSRIHVQRVIADLKRSGCIAWRRGAVEVLSLDRLRAAAQAQRAPAPGRGDHGERADHVVAHGEAHGREER